MDEEGSLELHGEKLGYDGPPLCFLISVIFYPYTLFRLKTQSPSDEGRDTEHLGPELGGHLS